MRWTTVVRGSILPALLAASAIPAVTQEGDFLATLRAVEALREEIKGMSLQDAKDTAITRAAGANVLVNADLTTIDGFDLVLHRVDVYGPVVALRDRLSGRSAWVTKEADANAAGNAARTFEISAAKMSEGIAQIVALSAIKGLVMADLDAQSIGGRPYQVQFCRDETHGPLAVLGDRGNGNRAALKNGVAAEAAMKAVSEAKFDGMTGPQIASAVKAMNLAKAGVVYASLGTALVDGTLQPVTFPARAAKTSCSF